MDNSQMTLNHLFRFEAYRIKRRQVSKIISINHMKDIRQKLYEKVQGIHWIVLLKEILQKIGTLLELPVFDILIAAWNQFGDLKACQNQSKLSPEESIIVPLAKHTIISEHNPSIDVIVNEKTIGSIQFPIHLTFKLNGLVLKFERGKLTEILSGECKGSGSVGIEQVTLIKKSFGPFQLPGAFNLKGGAAL